MSEPTEPAPSYYKFTPADNLSPDGIYATPWAGEVQPGQICEVRAMHAYHFDGHPDWESTTKKAFTAQQKEQS